MVGFVFCVLSMIGTFWATRKSLAAGIKALMVVGYFYGVGRGRYPDTLTHFTFDSALIVFYAVQFSKNVGSAIEQRSEAASAWTKALVIWPVICLAYSPFIPDSQPMIVQLVGLRGAVLTLPCIMVGAQMVRKDFDRLAPTLGLLNLVALGFAALEYVYGVTAVLPRNLTTENIYTSTDIHAGGELYRRIPSMFSSSHAYGAVMMFTIPFLIHGLEAEKWSRIICIAGLGAAVIGIFLCGSRMPVVICGLAVIYVLLTLRLRSSSLIAFALLGACAYYLVTHNERLQRFETLGDTDYVEARISGSINVSFFDAMGSYPLGAGLASAFGTNIPFFLQNLAHDPIGIESEYGHTLVEQGIPGLLLLVGFVLWMFSRTGAPDTTTKSAAAFSSVLVIVTWLGGAVGVGLLSGVPASFFLLLLTGMRTAGKPKRVSGLALRHVGQRREGTVRAIPRAALPGRAAARVSRPS